MEAHLLSYLLSVSQNGAVHLHPSLQVCLHDMAANSSAAHAASADDDLRLGDALAGFSREQLGQFVGALTEPTDERSKILLEAVADGTMAAALQVAAAQAAMPADAEERWGHAVAGHRCAGRDGNCFAKLARDNAALLDTLRSSLVQAKERAAQRKRLDASVPVAKQQKLAHDSDSSVQSALQASAAAAAQADAEERGAGASEAEAAAAVRKELRRLGCCHEAERALLEGFFGRSDDFMYYDRKKGGARAEGLEAARALEDLPTVEVIHKEPCPCGRHKEITLATLAEGRRAYKQAEGAAAKMSVVKEFVWDKGRGQLGSCDCDILLKKVFGCGAKYCAAVRELAQRACPPCLTLTLTLTLTSPGTPALPRAQRTRARRRSSSCTV